MADKFRQLMLELGVKGTMKRPATAAIHAPLSEAERSAMREAAWKRAHRDFKGKLGKERAMLVFRMHGTTLVPLSQLTDEELKRLVPRTATGEPEWWGAFVARGGSAGHLARAHQPSSGYWRETTGVGKDPGPPEWHGPDDHDIKPLTITASAAGAARHQTLALHRQGTEAGGLKVGSKVRFRNSLAPWILGDVQGEGEGVYASKRIPGGVSLVLYSPDYVRGMSGVWLSDVRPYR